MRTLNVKDVTRVLLYGVGITSLASIVYLAGPMLSIGGYHPLQSYIGRELALLVLFSAAGSFAGFQLWRRNRKAKALAAAVSGAEQKESDEGVLKDKMKDALTTLKSASGGKKDFLYD